MNDIVSLCLEDQIDLLEKREISSHELTSLYLENIEEKKDLNCFISINEDALEQASIIAVSYTHLTLPTIYSV